MFQAMIRQEHSGLLVTGLFAVLCAVAVWRVIAVAGLWVPLDPNEGWNAYHTAAVLGGSPLYPDPSGYLVNNYPPLSFYVVAAIGRLLGDTIVAGRILSLLSLATARQYSAEQLLRTAGTWLARSVIPIAALSVLLIRRRYEPRVQLVAIYAAVSVVIGMLFLGGAGVDWNVLFDADMALALSAAAVLDPLRGRQRGLVTA